MIECSLENIWYTRKSKRKRKKSFAFLLIIVLVFLVIYPFLISNKIYNYANDLCYIASVECVNKGVEISLTNKVNYNELVLIEKDSNGNVSLMSTDSYKLNSISREIEKQSFTLLKSRVDNGVQVPLLAFLGLDFISGYGKKINFKMLSASSVECDFLGKFSSVGINQTLHSIYINATCKIKITKFLSKIEQVYTSKILLCESIIVGKVPEIYLNGKLFN